METSSLACRPYGERSNLMIGLILVAVSAVTYIILLATVKLNIRTYLVI